MWGWLFAIAMLVMSDSALAAATDDNSQAGGWPPITAQCRPWTRWWWMGNAVDEANLKRELTRYHDAGLGGVEITPIYGVTGNEQNDIPYLSDQWMEMLDYATSTANQLGMAADMTMGTGWCMGGPTVKPEEGNALLEKNAFSQKPSGLMVKRAAPGGEGLMINPVYPQAMSHYLEWFDAPFSKYKPQLNCVFQDSYEYNTQWAPDFLSWFEKLRGYSLQDHSSDFFDGKDEETTARLKSDYRETFSDIMTEQSMPIWVKWAHDHHFQVRYQAHGAPANLLDLYAIADIPETEFFSKDRDILISKFASSAAHTNGGNVVGAETGTWLSEHFTETLAETKSVVDDMFLAGVNHVIYQGTAYSPDDAAWPGWCFYASAEMNPRNPIWHDVSTLNTYIARCQSVLQSGSSDSDVLLYWPIYDRWSDSKGLVQNFAIDGKDWFHGQPIESSAKALWNAGYAFDYISDRQILRLKTDSGKIESTGATYHAIVVPPCQFMPLETYRKLLDLAAAGATVIFDGKEPDDVPGWKDLESRRATFKDLRDKAQIANISSPQRLSSGQNHALMGDAATALEAAGIGHEELSRFPGIEFVRRRSPDGVTYFVANRGSTSLTDSVKLDAASGAVEFMNPMTGRTGLASSEASDGGVRVRFNLAPGESVIVRVFNRASIPLEAWAYPAATGAGIPLAGAWNIKFVDGGPALPAPIQTQTLDSWTKLGDESTQSFSGTAIYSITFDQPSGQARTWALDLGKVCESATVRLNGQTLGTLIVPPYVIRGVTLQPHGNLLEVEVTSTGANRIRDLDIRHVKWKIFEKPNVLNLKYKPFDASKWPITDCGLLGPVLLLPES